LHFLSMAPYLDYSYLFSPHSPVEDVLGLFSNADEEDYSRILALIKPLRILGRGLRAMDQHVRAHGVKWSVEDVVPTIPGEMDMLPQASRRSEL
jgi:hypothetical protein